MGAAAAAAVGYRGKGFRRIWWSLGGAGMTVVRDSSQIGRDFLSREEAHYLSYCEAEL